MANVADISFDGQVYARRRKLNSSIWTLENFLWAGLVVLIATVSAKSWLGLSRDYLQYLDYYGTIPTDLSFDDTRFEPGFHLSAWVSVNIFGFPFWIFSFIIIGTAVAIKVFLFRRYLSYPILGFIVYIFAFYPNQEYTQIRAALAISLGMLSIHLFLEKKIIFSFLICIISASFHYSIVLLYVAFAASYFFKVNFISISTIVLGSIAVSISMASNGGLNNTIIAWFSNLNPLVGGYVDNIADIDAVSILSVNNLIVIAIFLAAVAAGWLNRNDRQKYFTIMFGMSIVFVLILADSPIIAVRAKAMLLVSVVFAAFGQPIRRRDLIPVTLVFGNAALLLFLAIREGVILSGI